MNSVGRSTTSSEVFVSHHRVSERPSSTSPSPSPSPPTSMPSRPAPPRVHLCIESPLRVPSRGFPKDSPINRPEHTRALGLATRPTGFTGRSEFSRRLRDTDTHHFARGMQPSGTTDSSGHNRALDRGRLPGVRRGAKFDERSTTKFADPRGEAGGPDPRNVS